jgi:hypothetical protein
MSSFFLVKKMHQNLLKTLYFCAFDIVSLVVVVGNVVSYVAVVVEVVAVVVLLSMQWRVFDTSSLQINKFNYRIYSRISRPPYKSN